MPRLIRLSTSRLRFMPLVTLAFAVPTLAAAQGARPGTSSPPATAETGAPSANASATPAGRVTPSNLRGMGPNGATLRCRDGSYPPAFAPDAACADKGGVLVKFRVRGTPAPLPLPDTPTAAAASVVTPTMERPPSQANTYIPPAQKPNGATMMCGDGTYIVADTTAARCSQNGGVKVRFLPVPRR